MSVPNDHDPQLPGCFSPSLSFASHALDEERAFVWLGSLRDRGIGWEETRGQIIKFLREAKPDHIKRQLAKAELMLRPWLID